MKKSVLAISFLFLLIPTPSVFSDTLSQKDHGAWWVSLYGALSEKDHPLVSRATRVFEHVRKAADKRANRFPNLVILHQKDEPWVLSLKDGTILFTQKAVEICYQGVDETAGDSRMAFIIGHELAHLAKDDFWHKSAFETVKRFGPDSENIKKQILDLIRNTENIENTPHAREIVRKKELQADGYGLVYASMAGYDPRVIADEKGKNFFREWADWFTSNQATGKTAGNNESHPAPEQRAGFLLSKMKSLINDLDIFHIGVRLYQLGRYEDALAFFRTFNEKFPCREVSNNIGLIHYQMAIKNLAKCDRNRAYRFKLTATTDTETRAGLYKSQCGQSLFRQAIRHLENACDKDDYYVPARVNLSSALIMAGKYSRAMAVLDEALEIRKDDPEILNNRAIAMYLLGPSIKVDMFRQSVDALKHVIKENPVFSDAYYNLARLRFERGRNAASGETWKKYLKLESSGVYANIARDILGSEKESIAENNWQTTGVSTSLGTEICQASFALGISARSATPCIPTQSMGTRTSIADLTENNRQTTFAGLYEPPVKLGDVDSKTEKQLAGFKKYSLELGTIAGEYYVKQGILVLSLEDVVELVECPVKDRITLSKLEEIYGEPYQILKSSPQKKTLVYENFSVDVQDGITARVVYFEKGNWE
ncbi:MAG: tetratricopeptide repeat protein [Desulfobacterales bacterium]|nr:tetratricopeptide repeat protein [Desulfobacterales bacterium]